ncbi:hypothetical protein OTSANNIE_0798 [Anaplasma phagocytophilum str. Annie]|nr:hypothetical protein OTSANNIE_0798 [Anaplasma phagocytophilum str. Annie]
MYSGKKRENLTIRSFTIVQHSSNQYKNFTYTYNSRSSEFLESSDRASPSIS